MAKGTFATAINCMDGRVQEPVLKWVKERFHVDYVDMVTEPGPDGLMAAGVQNKIESIKERVLISVEKHNSKFIVMVSHYDCAGNPVSKEEHLNQLKKCMDIIKAWNLQVEIIGVWIDESWSVEIIDDFRI